MIVVSLFPILFPLAQKGLLLLSSFLIYLLEMSLLVVGLLLESLIFKFQLLLKFGHILVIFLFFSITIIAHLLHLVTEQPSQLGLVEQFLLLGFLLLKLVQFSIILSNLIPIVVLSGLDVHHGFRLAHVGWSVAVTGRVASLHVIKVEIVS